MASAKLVGGGQVFNPFIDNQLVVNSQVFQSDPSDFITVDTANSQFVINAGGAGVYHVVANTTIDGSQPGDTCIIWLSVSGNQILGDAGASYEYNNATSASLGTSSYLNLAVDDTVSVFATVTPSSSSFTKQWASLSITKAT